MIPTILEHDGIREFIAKEDIEQWIKDGKKICDRCKHIKCLCNVEGSSYYIGDKE